MKKLIIFAMLATVFMCGCDAVVSEPVTDNQVEKMVAEIKTETINVTPSPADVQSYEVMGEYEADLTEYH